MHLTKGRSKSLPYLYKKMVSSEDSRLNHATLWSTCLKFSLSFRVELSNMRSRSTSSTSCGIERCISWRLTVYSREKVKRTSTWQLNYLRSRIMSRRSFLKSTSTCIRWSIESDQPSPIVGTVVSAHLVRSKNCIKTRPSSRWYESYRDRYWICSRALIRIG